MEAQLSFCLILTQVSHLPCSCGEGTDSQTGQSHPQDWVTDLNPSLCICVSLLHAVDRVQASALSPSTTQSGTISNWVKVRTSAHQGCACSQRHTTVPCYLHSAQRRLPILGTKWLAGTLDSQMSPNGNMVGKGNAAVT